MVWLRIDGFKLIILLPLASLWTIGITLVFSIFIVIILKLIIFLEHSQEPVVILNSQQSNVYYHYRYMTFYNGI